MTRGAAILRFLLSCIAVKLRCLELAETHPAPPPPLRGALIFGAFSLLAAAIPKPRVQLHFWYHHLLFDLTLTLAASQRVCLQHRSQSEKNTRASEKEDAAVAAIRGSRRGRASGGGKGIAKRSL